MASTKPKVFIAFLRGINVGGNARVPMSELKSVFEELGYEGVKTYINSGNVVFMAAATSSCKLEPKIETALEAYFKFPIAVVVRDLAEMDAVVAKIPKKWRTPDDLSCNVIFLKHGLDNDEGLAHIEGRLDIDELHRAPAALLWAYKTSARGQSNLPKIIGTREYKLMTIRNLNTTLKVHELMKAADSSSS